MSPADKYREELTEAIYFHHYNNEMDTWECIVACEEQNRVGFLYQGKSYDTAKN